MQWVVSLKIKQTSNLMNWRDSITELNVTVVPIQILQHDAVQLLMVEDDLVLKLQNEILHSFVRLYWNLYGIVFTMRTTVLQEI